MADLRHAIQQQVTALFGTTDENRIDLTRPPGDPGLFAPGSPAWAVHADVVSMMIGGTAALLLQMLHPGALAGVWDHGSFRRDMQGRLRRTAQFISGTTYGSTATATALIDKVRTIHDSVAGTLPDGTPYSANDPDLLTWVHAAEVQCFLAAYLRYVDPAFSPEARDQYLDDTAEVAIRLGAERVPRSRAELAAYLADIRPALRYDHRTRTVAEALLDQPAATAALAPVQRLILDAAVDLLPPWAGALHGFATSAPRRVGTRIGARQVGGLVRWALQPAR